ncbi:C2H2-type domain-containing protein [Caenorhabditis elegans]|nr:C2H2-type domain-containing protein [Caenorhabditis elegans]CDK13430.1 C2H2-type domain-containing protein [Caenorhabditis elegans]|eukprot:NP_001293201.1 Uncharacterized protein CELE_ZK993.2 [Caenorhabditis elegans]
MENLSEILESDDLQGESKPLSCMTKGCGSDLKPRFCVTCALSSGIAEYHPSSGSLRLNHCISEIIIMDKANNFLICADCICNGDHSDHEILKNHEMGDMEAELQFLCSAARGFLMESHMDRGAIDCEILKDQVIKFRKYAVAMQMFLKTENWKRVEDEVMMNDLSVKFNAKIPEIMNAKKKALEMVKSIFTRNRKLRQRHLMYDQLEIQKYLDFTELKKSENSNEKAKAMLQKTIDQFQKCKEIYSKFCVIPLDPADALEIDREIEDKMRKLEDEQKKKTPMEVEEDSKFFKFRALQKEIERVHIQHKTCEKEWLTRRREVFHLISSRYKTISQLEQQLGNVIYTPTANAIWAYEITMKSLQNDKRLIKLFESISELLQARLMASKYFPDVPGKSYEDEIFKRLLVEDYDDQIGISWLQKILFMF